MAQSKTAKAMRGDGNGTKAKKIAHMEKVRATQPKSFSDVGKSGSYRKAYARNLKRAQPR